MDFFQSLTGFDRETADAFIAAYGGVEQATNAFLQGGGDSALDKKLTGDAGTTTTVAVSRAIAGGTLEICHGDLMNETTQAIVNPANSSLDHAGGLARMMVEKAGPVVTVESSSILDSRPTRRLQDGDAVVTSAGALSSKGIAHIIHVVAPIWSGPQDLILLQLTINNLFAQATSLKLASLSIPAVGSGIFGIPTEVCARELIIAAVRALSAPGTPLRTVRLCNHDSGTVKVFTDLFDECVTAGLAPHVTGAGAGAASVGAILAAAPPLPPKPAALSALPRAVSAEEVDMEEKVEDAEGDEDDMDLPDEAPDLTRQDTEMSHYSYVGSDDSEEEETTLGVSASIISLIERDCAEINESMLGCHAGYYVSPGCVFAQVAISTDRFHLDAETMNAWGLLPHAHIAFRLDFDRLYTQSLSRPKVNINHCSHCIFDTLDVKEIPPERRRPLALAWYIADRVKSGFLSRASLWPPKLSPRSVSYDVDKIISGLMDTFCVTPALARLALTNAKGKKHEAEQILLDDTKRSLLEAQLAGAASDDAGVIDLTSGVPVGASAGAGAGASASLSRMDSGGSPESTLMALFPDANMEVARAALALVSGSVDRAATKLLHHAGDYSKLLAEYTAASIPKPPKSPPKLVKQHSAIVVRPIEKFDPSSRPAEEMELVDSNYLVRLLHFIEEAVMKCIYSCLVCNDPLAFIGLKPTICAKQTCVFSAHSYGLGMSLASELRTRPSVADLMICWLYAAAKGGRVELCFPENVSATVGETVVTIAENDKAHLLEVLDALPPMKDMRKVARGTDSDGTMKAYLDSHHPLAYPLLLWLFASNRAHIRKLSEEEKLPGLSGDQFVLKTGPAEKEATFQALKHRSGSLFAWHGSATGNWHSISRNGLKNYSNTKFMSAGAACGAGIYFADALATSMGYARTADFWPHSRYANHHCLALCEVIDRRSEFQHNSGSVYVVQHEDWVTTRFFCIIPPGSASVTASVLMPAVPPGGGVEGPLPVPRGRPTKKKGKNKRR